MLLLVTLVLVVVVLILLRLEKIKRSTNTIGPNVLFGLTGTMRALHRFLTTNKATGFAHVWLGTKLGMYAVDAEAAQFLIMNTKQEKGILKSLPPFPPTVLELNGTSFVFANGDVWRSHRQVLNSGFNETAIRTYVDKSYQVMEKAISKISEYQSVNGTQVVPMKQWAHRITLDTLGVSIFGNDFGMLDGRIDSYYSYYSDLIHRSLVDEFIDRLHIPIITNKLKVCTKAMQQFLVKLIQEKRKIALEDATDIFTRLVHASDDDAPVKLSLKQIIADTFTIFLAGHETTANTLIFAFAELAQHPDCQEKLHEEISREIGQSATPTYEQLQSLKYLSQFLSENLRLHTPLGLFFTREATQDVVYDPASDKEGPHDSEVNNSANHHDKQFIPKGSLLAINYYSLHRNPKYWENPEKFDPDRFLPENVKKRHRFAYIPFAAGTRQCIGMQFSLMEQKMCVVKFLQKWKVVPPEDKSQLISYKRGILFFEDPVVNIGLVPRN